MDVDMEENEWDWELCKENVKPLKSGRRIGNLREALKKDNTSLRNSIQQFELQLRKTDGEAQINVWYNYVLWMEQHFVTSNSETEKVVQRCIQRFKDNKEYNQCQKYVLIWLKLCEKVDEPGEIFNYMFDQDIGTSSAIFYKLWAEHFELFGSIKKADELYTLGISRNAEPVDLLKNCKKEFEMRMLKRKAQADSPVKPEISRTILGGLKVTKTGKVGNDRTKQKLSGNMYASSLKSINKANSSFAIYGDESSTASLLTASCQIKELPTNPARHKENKKQREKMKGIKVTHTQNVMETTKQKFEIFTEETEEPSNPTPHQFVLSNRKPLSSRINERDPYRFYDHKEDSADPKVIIKYCKSVIYMGAKELSFEELKSQLSKYSNSQQVGARSKLQFNDMVVDVKNNEGIEVEREIEEDITDEHIWQLNLTENNKLETNQQQRGIEDGILEKLGEDFDAIGVPNYESTSCFHVNKNFHELTDVYMRTPDGQHKEKPDGTINMLSELEETKLIFKGHVEIDDLKIQIGTPVKSNEKVSTMEFKDHSLIQNNVVTDELKQLCDDSFMEAGLNRCKNIKRIVTDMEQLIHADVEQLKQSNSEVEQLRQLNQLTNEFFNDEVEYKVPVVPEIEKLQRLGTGDFFESSSIIKTKKDQSTLSELDLLKQLNLSSEDCFGDPIASDDLLFQKPVFSKTPTGKQKVQTNESLWAPSPTLNTKYAKDNIQSMFDISTGGESSFFKAPQEIKRYNEVKSNDNQNGFPIFSDNDDNKKGFTVSNENKGKKEKGFTIFNDGEEKKKKGFTEFNDNEENKGFAIYNENVDSQRKKQAFQLYRDTTETFQQEPTQSNIPTQKSTNENSSFDEMNDEITAPLTTSSNRPASTPFMSSHHATLGSNFSNITCGIENNLSTIQERSREDERNIDEQEHKLCLFAAFDAECTAILVNRVMPTINSSNNFINISGPLQKLQGSSFHLNLGPRHLRIIKCILKGGQSATYKAVNDSNEFVFLKISKCDPNLLLWDLYITNEIHRRLPDCSSNIPENFIKHIMVSRFSDAVCVETPCYSEGNLMDAVNLYKKYNCPIDESLAMLYAYEILQIVKTLHACDIIHADLTPEKFLQTDSELTGAGPLSLRYLALKGFENSIDVTALPDPKNVMLTGSNKSDSYECYEMKNNKPWKYEVDYFAAAATIHVVVFQSLMNTYIYPNTNWLRISNSPHRDWNVDLWTNLFSCLINFSSHNSPQMVQVLINQLASELVAKTEELEDAISKKNDLLMNDD